MFKNIKLILLIPNWFPQYISITQRDLLFKSFVLDTLADTKQLRGGVIFLKELPQTSTSKINRRKLASMALSMERE